MPILIILVILLATGAAAQAVCVRRDRRRFPPPGAMIDGLHVRRMGDGGPVVIFEAGIAASCLNWNRIQADLASSATTWSYDRQGFGWSVAGNGRCSLDQITEQLHSLIGALGVTTPIVFVGHSFGGYIARYFIDRYPAVVAALVLVDPATPEEWIAPTSGQRWRLGRAVFFTRFAAMLATFGVIRMGLWSLLRRGNGNAGPVLGLSDTMRRVAGEVNKLSRSAGVRPSEGRTRARRRNPEQSEGPDSMDLPTPSLDVVRLLRSRWSEPKFYRTMAGYIQALPRCAREVSKCKLPEGLPVTVISSAQLPPERMAEHAALATKHIIANQSGHWVHLDEPELVVEAIREKILNLKF